MSTENKILEDIVEKINEYLNDVRNAFASTERSVVFGYHLRDSEVEGLKGIIKKQAATIKELLEGLKEIRDTPKSWKAGGMGGQDQYAGMPPFLRIVDSLLNKHKQTTS